MGITLPEVWPPDRYVRPIRHEASGQIAWTHLAQVRAPDNTPLRAYIKHYGANAPHGLFNEWFGYAVLSALGVPQPRAALMQAPLFGASPPQAALAFVSCEPLPSFEGTPKQLYRFVDPAQHAKLVNRLFTCPALPLLVAADQLVANGDRNIGNLVFTGKQAFVAIDHGNILGGQSWVPSDLWFTQNWAVSKLIELLVPIDSLTLSMKNSLYASAEVVEEGFFNAQSDLKTKLAGADLADPAELDAALQAVWWRCFTLAASFKERLKLVI
jgi:hypothetical protein